MEKLLNDTDGIRNMHLIMWRVKRLLGRLYVKKFYSRNYGGRQHIFNHLLQYDMQFSMRVTTS